MTRTNWPEATIQLDGREWITMNACSSYRRDVLTADQPAWLAANEDVVWRKPESNPTADPAAALKADMREHEALRANDPAPAEPKISISFMKDATGSAMTVEQLTLQELAGRIQTTTAKSKDALPLIKMANFGDTKSKNGSLRYNANLLTVTGTEADYDGKKMSFDDAEAIAEKAGLEALLYTTPSYTDDEPKWRILCPTSAPLPAKERDKLIARINGLFGGIFAPESFTLSQPYYIGSIGNNPMHRVVITKGDFIDRRSDLDAKAIGRAKATAKDAGAVGEVEVHGYEGHIALLGDGEGLRGFNATLLSATSAYAIEHGKNLDREKLKALLRAAVNAAPKMAGREWAVYLTDTYLDSAIDGAIEKFGDKPWPDGKNKKTGLLNPAIMNTIYALGQLDLEYMLDTFRHQQFVKGKVADEAFDGEISDAIITMARIGIRMQFGFYPAKDVTTEAIIYACRRNQHNPVVEKLDSLKWDKQPRLDRMLVTYLGAKDTPYVRAISRKTGCALVRRAKQPGCKFDHVLTLDGPQDIGKTMFCKDLAGEKSLYTDTAIIAHSAKEAMEAMGSKWVIEIGEMAGFSDTAREKVKAFITREEDRARMAYDRFAVDQPRSCIFIATKNPGGIFNDPTGERRWWDVSVTKYDRVEFLKDRDQILAEAVVAEPNEKLWLYEAGLKEAHAEQVATKKAPNEMVDVLRSLRGNKIGTGQFSVDERISNADVRKKLGLDNSHTVTMHGLGRKIADAMTHLGWIKIETSMRCSNEPGAQTERGYRRPWVDRDDEPGALNLGDAQAQVPF